MSHGGRMEKVNSIQWTAAQFQGGLHQHYFPAQGTLIQTPNHLYFPRIAVQFDPCF